MKGYRFYLEYGSKKNKRNGIHEGNVYAACLREDGHFETWNGFDPALCSGLGAIFFHPNSAVVYCASSIDRLRETCKRIPEAKARQIHPALFARLDEKED